MEEIKRHRQSDCDSLANFMNKYFPQRQDTAIIRARSADYYRWKYDNNPFGRPIVYHYWKNSELVGTSGAVPLQLSVRGEIVLAYERCDSFVAPPHQGKGIHKELADIVFDEIDRNSSISYGTGPTDVNLRILIKHYNVYKGPAYRRMLNVLRVTDILRAKNYGKIARFSAWLELLNRIVYGVPKARIEETRNLPQNFCNIPDASTDFCIVRSFEYLKYRYIDCPERYQFYQLEHDSQLYIFVVKIVDWGGIRLCYLVDVVPPCGARKSHSLLLQTLRQIGIQTLSTAALVDVPCGFGHAVRLNLQGFLIKRQKECIELRQNRWPFLNPASPDYNEDRWIFFAGNGDDL